MVNILGLTILAVTFAFPVNASTAKIYVWRNENGGLVFSDSPKAGAEEVNIKSDNIIKSSIPTSTLDITPQVLDERYHVVISHPEDNATIRDNTGSVYVSGGIKPLFKRGFKIQLYLDGKPTQEPQTHSMFALRNIDRGEHQIKMELIDEKGKVIAYSNIVTFYMHRSSVN